MFKAHVLKTGDSPLGRGGLLFEDSPREHFTRLEVLWKGLNLVKKLNPALFEAEFSFF